MVKDMMRLVFFCVLIIFTRSKRDDIGAVQIDAFSNGELKT